MEYLWFLSLELEDLDAEEGSLMSLVFSKVCYLFCLTLGKSNKMFFWKHQRIASIVFGIKGSIWEAASPHFLIVS